MLSYTCKTAIKAVIYLSSRFESGENAGIKTIADSIDASEHTVGKLLQVLVKQGVIKMQQPIIHIVEAIDGKQVFTACGLEIADLCDPVNNGLAYLS